MTKTVKQRVLEAFPEAKLLSSGNGRYEAYVTIHGEFCNGEDAAWESLAVKLGDRIALKEQP